MTTAFPLRQLSNTASAYFELSRLHYLPYGALLVFLPCVWGVTLAAFRLRTEPQELITQTSAFLLGSLLLHAAMCSINDICDVDLDRQVERSKNRPLVSGRASMFGASVWTASLTLGAVTFLQYTNDIAFRVGLVAVFPLNALYPLMKRWTHWPQAWLGLAANWGILVAWISAIEEPHELKTPVALFCGSICWTIFYDTINACQDKKDDTKAGIKTTVTIFGDWIKPILAAFATFFIISLATAGYLNGNGAPFFLLSVGGASLHFIWQITTLDVDSPLDCWEKFKANHTLGGIVWAGMLADYYVQLKV